MSVLVKKVINQVKIGNFFGVLKVEKHKTATYSFSQKLF